MLVQLSVRDFAVIASLDLGLEPSMTALTGETGAGKSILVDALGLALGERAHGDLIRVGRERADVSALFDVSEVSAARSWLSEHELESPEGECLLRRSVGSDGRSRAWINTRPVPVQVLRELGDMLIDIHGQHAHQSLLHRATQRRIVDEYAGHEVHLDRIAALHVRWSELREALAGLEAAPGEAQARLELLRYQLQELRRLDLQAGEPAQLDEEHRRLSHVNELRAACAGALERLAGDDEGAALTQLGSVLRLLGDLRAYDGRLESTVSLLESALIHIEEAAGELRDYGEGLELDPERYQWLEERLRAVHELARKHHVAPGDLPGLCTQLAADVEALEDRGGRREGLARELNEVAQCYAAQAQALHESRCRAAAALAEEITANMHELGMPGGRFQVNVEHPPDARPAAHGLDRVEFVVSTDPGQTLAPLARVASGGELSRISLAIQMIASQGSGVPTLIFDEVDAGIGGRIAEIVGQRLRKLGQRRQVLCVTHLPQVAAQAQHHIRVQKHSQANATRTELEALGGEERVREIARMLGGIRITAQTLAHAREMLARA